MKCFIQYPKLCDFPIENLPYGVFSTSDNVSVYLQQIRIKLDHVFDMLSTFRSIILEFIEFIR